MKTPLLLPALALVLVGCNLFPQPTPDPVCAIEKVGPFEENIERCASGECAFRYYENSELSAVWMDHPETGISSPSFFNVNNGSFRVFEFEFVYADDSFIADDELTEYFRFQVPMGQTDFTICLGSEDFEDWAYWQAICFCPWSTAPVSGFIEGKFLLTGAYEISVNLEWINLADQPETLLFTQTFFPAP